VLFLKKKKKKTPTSEAEVAQKAAPAAPISTGIIAALFLHGA